MLNAFYYLVSRTIAEPFCCRPLQSEFIHGIWVLGSRFSGVGWLVSVGDYTTSYGPGTGTKIPPRLAAD